MLKRRNSTIFLPKESIANIYRSIGMNGCIRTKDNKEYFFMIPAFDYYADYLFRRKEERRYIVNLKASLMQKGLRVKGDSFS
jgi:hypothetical protein